MSILSNYSDEEFKKIVADSLSIRDVLRQLGYNAVSGSISQLVKERIELLQLDTSHFYTKTPVKRDEKNIFIENSTADQRTLRRWYVKGNYTPYKCSICGLEPFWNNKELTLILDHINGNNKDDRLENLRWICPNCNQQLDTTNGKNKKHKEHSLNYCVDCGAVISAKSVRCMSCASKQRTTPYVPEVTREELKSLIRTLPFTQIGAKFGVSDNTIRKWCIKYNLPSKVSEIKQITDDDWKNM